MFFPDDAVRVAALSEYVDRWVSYLADLVKTAVRLRLAPAMNPWQK